MFLGLVLTARHGMEGSNIGSPSSNKGAHGRITDWAEVVTRYPYENVRMDYLLISFLKSSFNRLFFLIFAYFCSLKNLNRYS
jgi:hypothetical protein